MDALGPASGQAMWEHAGELRPHWLPIPLDQEDAGHLKENKTWEFRVLGRASVLQPPPSLAPGSVLKGLEVW